MRPLRYAINITVDGCVDHTAGIPAQRRISMPPAISTVGRRRNLRPRHLSDDGGSLAACSGRQAGRQRVQDGCCLSPTRSPQRRNTSSQARFSRSTGTPNSCVATSSRRVRALKAQPGRGIVTGGVTLPLALARMGLIDEYEFVVPPPHRWPWPDATRGGFPRWSILNWSAARNSPAASSLCNTWRSANFPTPRTTPARSASA